MASVVLRDELGEASYEVKSMEQDIQLNVKDPAVRSEAKFARSY